MHSVRVIENKGTGRSFIILHEAGRYVEFSHQVTDVLALKSKVLRIEINTVNENNWELLTGEVEKCLDAESVKQTSIVAFGSASTIAQHFTLLNQKKIRSLILVDAETRPHPGRVTKIIDWLENKLPLGLPLRSNSNAFDGKPFLQRIRCPVMIVLSPDANSYLLSESESLLEKLPISWKSVLKAKNGAEELALLASEFQDVRAKCPQKAKAARVRAVNENSTNVLAGT
ncbi:MAG: hypothetical protein KDD56_00080 [Bdellovibrionales bacterium]|nr:hypothetical protein [Bdellovibrionales bacterium]